MLGPRLAVVPFLDHRGQLGDLVRWASAGPHQAIRILAGPAGVGKSRLGVQWCQEMARHGWLAGMLAARRDVEAVETLLNAPTPRAVMVDGTGGGAEIVDLASAVGEHASNRYPVRILVTVRNRIELTDLTDRIAARLGPGRAEVVTVTGLGDNLAARRQLHASACRALAVPLGRPNLAVSAPPDQLDRPLYATPLMILMAAWLTVHADGPLPVTAAELVGCLIDDHEDRYWMESAGSQQPPLAPSKDLRRRVVALSTLAGADSEDEAAELMRLVAAAGGGHVASERWLARWAGHLYPGPRWWNPLEPDLVAEHLVASTFGRQPDVLRSVLADRAPGALDHPLRLLARAIPAHPELAASMAGVIDGLLGSLCQQAVQQATARVGPSVGGTASMAAVLTDVVRVCPPDPAHLAPILDELPAGPDRDLSRLAATLTDQARAHYQSLVDTAPDEYRADLAICLNNLSVRLADLGRYEEALLAVDQAIEHFHRLTTQLPGAYRSEFATARNNQSLRLAEVGRRDDARAAAEEAVTHYRELAQADAGPHRAQLARALNNLSIRLADLGRWEGARAAAEEAVDHYRQVPAAGSKAYLANLAALLDHLAQRLTELDQREEARAAAEEAVAHYRQLAETDATYGAQLVRALNHLSVLLAGLGRRDAALAVAREAVRDSRRLAVATPSRSIPELAWSLRTLSSALVPMGRREEARAASQEAVGHYRDLAAARPRPYLPQLAAALGDLSARLADLDLSKNASATQAEASSLLRQCRQRGWAR